MPSANILSYLYYFNPVLFYFILFYFIFVQELFGKIVEWLNFENEKNLEFFKEVVEQCSFKKMKESFCKVKLI